MHLSVALAIGDGLVVLSGCVAWNEADANMLASVDTREAREDGCGALHLRSGFMQCASGWPVVGATYCHNLVVIAVGRLVVADDGKPTPGQA